MARDIPKFLLKVRLMRVKVARNCGLSLSHKLPNALLLFKQKNSVLPKYSFIEHYRIRHSTMSSTARVKEQWPALRVRETFLDFFKKNGHTFGLVPAQGLQIYSMLIRSHSAIFFSGASL